MIQVKWKCRLLKYFSFINLFCYGISYVLVIFPETVVQGKSFRGNCLGAKVLGVILWRVIVRGQLSRGIIQGQLSWDQKSGGQLSWGEFHGGNCPGCSCPGGNCYWTDFYIENWKPYYTNFIQRVVSWRKWITKKNRNFIRSVERRLLHFRRDQGKDRVVLICF